MNIFNSRLFSLIRKEFIQILRDPRTLALILGIPIMQLLLMGYAATTDVRNLPLVIYDQDRGPAARRLLDAYRAADYFSLQYDVSSEQEMIDLIDSGFARAGLIIPPDYSNKVDGGGTAVVAFVLDGSDPTVASTSLSAAQLIAQQYATQLQAKRMTERGQLAALQLPVEVRTRVWYNPDMASAKFMIPGVIGIIMFALTSILTATAVVRERERGTIEQLIVTPIRPWELVVGKLVPYIIVAYLCSIEVLTLGALLFDIPIQGDLVGLFLISGLFLMTSLGIGLLASTIANTQQEAMLMVFMTLLPNIFLSGYFFPLAAMPEVLKWISYLIPLRYYLVIIRSILVKGVGISAVQNEVIALAIFGVIIMTLAALRFRKRLD
jgi:ABC-2 type transport system permease protein